MKNSSTFAKATADKKLKIIGAALLLFCVSALHSQAQSSPTNSIPSFLNTLETYLSSHDTNNTALSLDRGRVWTGPKTQNGVTVADSLGIDLNVWRPATNDVVSLESVTDNAGIAGTIVTQRGGAGFGVIIYDVQLTAHAGVGYDFPNSRVFGYVAADAIKMMTGNTYAGIRLDTRFGKELTPELTIQAGITF